MIRSTNYRIEFLLLLSCKSSQMLFFFCTVMFKKTYAMDKYCVTTYLNCSMKSPRLFDLLTHHVAFAHCLLLKVCHSNQSGV
jgi:hypothetical protein